ncbi:MarR family transcriptional regulator [Afipia sp. P52-10]|jgi:DNA-binding MarR family transcriptional regulator|uniref:MarR family winged helix-turn-helix transcriptional regulator n=1 Tax=Afipia sp. P52-10 TaxID=1429916 RepID=UPI0003DF23F7|nr:MarR family transcriptional regulator [Afipia sp. P52-10]ETR78322.1 MarR family transcriptional regulator [Afipia sp. P52-10]
MSLVGTDELMQAPGFLLRRCSQVVMAIFLEETAGCDLTPAQFGAMVLIADQPGMDQTRLMQLAALDRSSVTNTVERLEKRGLIKRKVDPDDRRARKLTITDKGLKLLNAARPGAQRAQERILAPLGAERSAAFVAMLREVADAHNESSRVPHRP